MKKIINSTQAPVAIGPYSQALAFKNLLFTSGQLPLNPETMVLVEGGIEEQSKQSLINLKKILEAGGASLETVLKTTCFLTDMEHFTAFNKVYHDFFGESAPARSCVQVTRLPKDALIEIEVIAYID